MMELRKDFIGFKVTEKERRVLTAIAEGEGIRISEAARLLIREAAERRGMGKVGFLSMGESRGEDNHGNESEPQ
jgi:hypothetical protein